MKEKCRLAVSKAVGRDITNKEAEGLESRLISAMRDVARRDPAAWKGMSQQQRFREAAQAAAAQISGEAKAKQIRVAQAASAQARWLGIVDDAKTGGRKQSEAVFAELERVDHYRKGVERDYFRQVVDAIEAVNGRMLGMIEDSRVAKALVDEIFGRDSGSTVAKQAAKAWLDVAESMRVRFNAAGGDVGRLDYSYLPQPHDQVRVLKAGQQQWIDDTLPLLDRSRYVQEDGTRMTDIQVRAMLAASWQTLSSGGANKQTPGAFKGRGSGLMANPSNKERQIHFAGPDEYQGYMQAYGRGSVLGAMQGHIGRMAKDIALAETMGPNWNQTFRVTKDTIRKNGEGTAVRTAAGMDVESAFGTLTGAYNTPAHARFAEIAQGARNIEVAAKLGGAVLSSVTDIGTMAVTAGFHRLPIHTLALNVVRSFGKDATNFANRAGLMADSLITDMNRWAEGNIGAGWTGKLANATMKASLMNAWTDSMRRAFSLTMMGGLGRLNQTAWSSLKQADRTHLTKAGITESDWTALQGVKPEMWRGEPMLTPEAIRASGVAGADRLAAKVLGYVVDESEYAVVNPDLATRTIQQAGTNKGTATGELWRSIMLFKSFPVAMITRHWRRSMDESLTPAKRLAYAGTLLTGLTTMGYVAMSMKDVARGKDPKDTTDPRTWAAAFAQGGGQGLLGDFFFSGENRFGGGILGTLAGPLLGDAGAVIELAGESIRDTVMGEVPDTGAKALRTAVGLTPGASLWYARAALERAVLHDMQEALSPGYLSRMEARAQKEYGVDFWWRPGSIEPARAPDLSRAIGGAP